MSVLGPTVWSMTRYVDEDLHGAEFRECDLTGARLIGVVMQDAVIDGLITYTGISTHTADSPSSTSASVGDEVMNSTSSPKNGFSACSS